MLDQSTFVFLFFLSFFFFFFNAKQILLQGRGDEMSRY